MKLPLGLTQTVFTAGFSKTSPDVSCKLYLLFCFCFQNQRNVLLIYMLAYILVYFGLGTGFWVWNTLCLRVSGSIYNPDEVLLPTSSLLYHHVSELSTDFFGAHSFLGPFWKPVIAGDDLAWKEMSVIYTGLFLVYFGWRQVSRKHYNRENVPLLCFSFLIVKTDEPGQSWTADPFLTWPRLVPACVSSGRSGVLPQTKKRAVRLIGNNNLSTGQSVSVFFSYPSDWQIQSCRPMSLSLIGFSSQRPWRG